MTFSTREESRSLGKPVELYFFRYGDAPDAYFAYTDAEQQIAAEFDPDMGQIVFMPIPIERDDITASGGLDKTTMQVRTPHDSELVDMFRLHPPSQVVTLTIYKGHADENEFIVQWTGRVLGGGREGNEAVYTCEPVSTSMKRPGLRRNYQYQCVHVLYGPQCKADRERVTITRSVTGVAGALVSFAGDLGPNPDIYNGGLLEWTTQDGRTEVRTIKKRADSDTFILSGTVVAMEPGMSIRISAGCKHNMDDCRGLHDNILNFGGQPWIPTKNPIGITNSYY